MDEQEPVEDHEFVFRRIHPKFYMAAAAVPVLYEAFRPSRSDTTGLSVVRAKFAKPEDCLSQVDAASVHGYAVARLLVRDLRQLGLTVQPEPLAGGPPGHAVIAELSWNAYGAAKKDKKLTLFELAKLASANLVYPPGGS